MSAELGASNKFEIPANVAHEQGCSEALRSCALAEKELGRRLPTSARDDTHLLMTNPFEKLSNFEIAKSDLQNIHETERLRVAMAWTPADNQQEDLVTAMARHDLVFSGVERFKLRWDEKQYKGLATCFTDKSIADAQAMRAELEQKNPNIKLLTELRYRDAPADYLPANSDWWLKDKGQVLTGWQGKDRQPFQKLDFTNSKFQDQVAAQARAAIKSGAVDGVMLDWFNDGEEKSAPFDEGRLQLLTKIREAIGPDKLIMVNSNATLLPEAVTKQVNGYYMECNQSTTPEDWQQIAKTLDYAEANTRPPHVNIVETWPDEGKGREQQNKMRATMTLVMTHAPDGYGLFADADGMNKDDHSHDWYRFYDTPVGKSVGGLELRADGSSAREYSNGTVLYNPAGNKPVTVTFNELRLSAHSGKWGKTFSVDPEDGDIFSR